MPEAGLIFDKAGNLYGTTAGGCRDVFKLRPNSNGSWTFIVLHEFSCGDGAEPFAPLIFDKAGNLYGTTPVGGVHDAGVVFELKRNSDGSWTESVLYTFANHPGANPLAGLTFDAAGNLYTVSDDARLTMARSSN